MHWQCRTLTTSMNGNQEQLPTRKQTILDYNNYYIETILYVCVCVCVNTTYTPNSYTV